MSSNHRSPITELLDRLDLDQFAAIVEQYAGPGRRSGRGWLYRCPLHDDSTPSFSVSVAPDGRPRARCFGCDWRGDALGFVQAVEHLPGPREALARLRTLAGVTTDTPYRDTVGRPTPAVAPSQTPEMGRRSAPVALLPTEVRHPAEVVADSTLDRYLDRRHWPAEVVDRFGLSVVLDRWGRPRVRHPFYVPDGAGGRVLANWQDRATGEDDHGRKWDTPTRRPLPLYNLPDLDDADLAVVVVCEGPADTITAAVALDGYPWAAAVGVPGAAGWHRGWAELLAGLSVVLAADDDDAGDRLTARITTDLDGHGVCVHRLELHGGDLTERAAVIGTAGVAAEVLALLNGCATCAGRVVPVVLDDRLDEAVEVVPVSCPVCSRPVARQGARWCVSCTAAEVNGPHRWRQCTDCHGWALAPVGRRCILSVGCTGTYATAVVGQVTA